jgi:hypothetical protein
MAHHLAHALGGPDSEEVHDAVWRLLLPRLRPELRRWYHSLDGNEGPIAVALRAHLSQLVGKALEGRQQDQVTSAGIV